MRPQFLIVFSAATIVLLPGLIFLTSFTKQEKQPDATPPLRPKITAPAGMVHVSGGTFIMGADEGDEYERPAHPVTVKPFFIDLHEVTCAQYSEFIKATGRKAPEGWTMAGYPTGAAQQPVTGVDWFDAQAYADWAGKRLPTEREWEFAARGTDRRRYSWGNDWRAGIANAGESSAGRLVDVGLYADGKSPFGVLDMIGNAWEWTASDLEPYPGAVISDSPIGPRKIIRGGSWVKDSPPDWTTTFRGFALPSGGRDYSKIGFRCARDAPTDLNMGEKGR